MTFWWSATITKLHTSSQQIQVQSFSFKAETTIWKFTIKAEDPGQTCSETSSNPPIRWTYNFLIKQSIQFRKYVSQKGVIKQTNDKKEISIESRETKKWKSTSNSVSKPSSTSSDNIWDRPVSTISGESIWATDVLQFKFKMTKSEIEHPVEESVKLDIQWSVFYL